MLIISIMQEKNWYIVHDDSLNVFLLLLVKDKFFDNFCLLRDGFINMDFKISSFPAR